jgi:hypothetical protein
LTSFSVDPAGLPPCCTSDSIFALFSTRTEVVRLRNPETGAHAAKVSNPKFRGKRGNFLDISKGNSHPGMRKFESSEVSQPVWQLEIVPPKTADMPANSGPQFKGEIIALQASSCSIPMSVRSPEQSGRSLARGSFNSGGASNNSRQPARTKQTRYLFA